MTGVFLLAVGLVAAAGASAQDVGCDGPQNVRATPLPDGNLVEWDRWSFARGYEIFRAVPGGEPEMIGFGGGHNSNNPNTTGEHDTEFLDEDVVPGQTYVYTVRALAPPPHISDFCGSATVTTIPVFPTLLAGAAATLAGVAGYGLAGRRRS